MFWGDQQRWFDCCRKGEGEGEARDIHVRKNPARGPGQLQAHFTSNKLLILYLFDSTYFTEEVVSIKYLTLNWSSIDHKY